jgi:hypothetical protein
VFQTPAAGGVVLIDQANDPGEPVDVGLRPHGAQQRAAQPAA